MFQTGFRPGSVRFRRFGEEQLRQIRHIERKGLGLLVNIPGTPAGALQVVSALFPDFSGRAMLFGACDRLEFRFCAARCQI